MYFSRTALVATGFALSLIGPVAAQDASAQDKAETEAPKIEAAADTVVATVNGTEITVGHIVSLGQRLPDEYRALESAALFKGILDQLIQQSILAEQANAGSLAIKYALENERRAMLATEALTEIGAAAATDEAVQAIYDARFGAMELPQDFLASHILVETEEEANAVIAELEGGADFAETAKAKSIGPSGPSGGDLGWIAAGRTVPEFEDAVRALEPGQTSAPTQSQFGWHVIKLFELRDATPPTLEQVREGIEAELGEQAIDAQITALEQAATIVRSDEGIDPAVVLDVSILQE